MSDAYNDKTGGPLEGEPPVPHPIPREEEKGASPEIDNTRRGEDRQDESGRLAEEVAAELFLKPVAVFASENEGNDRLLAEVGRNDSGNARRLVSRYGDRIRYVPAWSTWLFWDRMRWREDDHNYVRSLARATAHLIWDECEAMRKEGVDHDEIRKHVAWWNTSQSAGRIDAMLKLAASDPMVVVTPEQLDQRSGELNVLNGTLDLETGRLKPHTQADLWTKVSLTAYRGDEPCGPECEWESFLATVMPDSEVRAFVQRYSAYASSGYSDLKTAVFLHGNADTGKTTFVETMRGVLGSDYTVEVARTLLVATRSDRHETEIVDLHGKRLATVSELESGKRFDVAKFKTYTGGDLMAGRRLYQNRFSWKPTHAFILTGNRKPEVRGSDDAFWRRMRLVRFDQVIPRDGQRVNLAEALAEEHGPCVLAWLVRGMRDLDARGLAEPQAVVVATEDYRHEEDHVAAFLEETVTQADGSYVGRVELHQRYESWCMTSGVRRDETFSMKDFNQELEARGWVKAKPMLPDGRRVWSWRAMAYVAPEGVRL